MTPSQEEWRPVVGYEGSYEVSDHGNVRGLDRTGVNSLGRRRVYPSRMLKPHINGQTGRRMVWLCRDAERERFTVYSLVLAAFVGPRPDGLIACHGDDDCTNDRLDNLRWDTPSANNLDNVRLGNHGMARRTHCIRGHLLAEPNLLRSSRPGRWCRACHNARGAVVKAKRRGLAADVDALADENYERNMRLAM